MCGENLPKIGREKNWCDTCDSKKTTSLLEGARIYAREGLEGDKQSVDTGKQWYEHTETREYRDTEIREG